MKRARLAADETVISGALGGGRTFLQRRWPVTPVPEWRPGTLHVDHAADPSPQAPPAEPATAQP